MTTLRPLNIDLSQKKSGERPEVPTLSANGRLFQVSAQALLPNPPPLSAAQLRPLLSDLAVGFALTDTSHQLRLRFRELLQETPQEQGPLDGPEKPLRHQTDAPPTQLRMVVQADLFEGCIKAYIPHDISEQMRIEVNRFFKNNIHGFRAPFSVFFPEWFTQIQSRETEISKNPHTHPAPQPTPQTTGQLVSFLDYADGSPLVVTFPAASHTRQNPDISKPGGQAKSYLIEDFYCMNRGCTCQWVTCLVHELPGAGHDAAVTLPPTLVAGFRWDAKKNKTASLAHFNLKTNHSYWFNEINKFIFLPLDFILKNRLMAMQKIFKRE